MWQSISLCGEIMKLGTLGGDPVGSFFSIMTRCVIHVT